MRKILRGRRPLTFANVVSLLALFVALGGSSYAAISLPSNSVGSAQIRTASVGSSEIKTGAVKSSEIATNAVGRSEIRADAVNQSEIAANAVGTSELGSNAVTGTKLAPGAVASAQIADNTVSSADVQDGSLELGDLSVAAKAALGTTQRESVASNGAAVNGTARSTARTATGTYVVDFGADVSQCQVVATPATLKVGSTTDAPPAGARLGVAPGAQAGQVAVTGFDAAGTAADVPFNLIAAC
jgi:hypothetical protein